MRTTARAAGVALGSAVLSCAGAAAAVADGPAAPAEDYRQALDAFFDGDDEAAADHFAAVLEAGVASELAEEFLTTPRATDDGGRDGLGAGPAAGLAGAALLTGAVVLVRRRRSTRVQGGMQPVAAGVASGLVPAQRTPAESPRATPH